MLGAFVIFIFICIILAEKETMYDINVKPYKKAKKRNKYGIWLDGYGNQHFGRRDKICYPFTVNGHKLMATANVLSYNGHGEFNEFDELARDLTLEQEVKAERGELECFRRDMAARDEAVANGNQFYKSSIRKKGLDVFGYYSLYRQCVDNRLYSTWAKIEDDYYNDIHEYEITKVFYGADLSSARIADDDYCTEMIPMEIKELPVMNIKEAQIYRESYGIYSAIEDEKEWKRAMTIN